MTVDRFWSKVDRRGPSECWEWTGGRTSKGYGWFAYGGTQIHAHRHALALTLGRPVQSDRLACHHCDNPGCCNPAHLYEGDASDNMRDAWSRGRRPDIRGSNNPNWRQS